MLRTFDCLGEYIRDTLKTSKTKLLVKDFYRTTSRSINLNKSGEDPTKNRNQSNTCGCWSIIDNLSTSRSSQNWFHPWCICSHNKQASKHVLVADSKPRTYPSRSRARTIPRLDNSLRCDDTFVCCRSPHGDHRDPSL